MTTTEAPFALISSFYDELVAKHGDDPRSCDYGSSRSQAVKFDVIADAADLTGLSVLDVGCGLAHFADHLERRYPGVEYAGIDLSPQMIAQARARRPDLRLEVGNLLDYDLGRRFDVVVANGIFYLLGPEAPVLLRSLVTRMWSLADQLVAFTTLSTWAPEHHAGEFQADPLDTLGFCRTLTPRITLRHDYMPHDFTVFLHREPAA